MYKFISLPPKVLQSTSNYPWPKHSSGYTAKLNAFPIFCISGVQKYTYMFLLDIWTLLALKLCMSGIIENKLNLAQGEMTCRAIMLLSYPSGHIVGVINVPLMCTWERQSEWEGERERQRCCKESLDTWHSAQQLPRPHSCFCHQRLFHKPPNQLECSPWNRTWHQIQLRYCACWSVLRECCPSVMSLSNFPSLIC